MREEVHAITRELEWYNQLVGHVGIQGQRRFTEALEKRFVATLIILVRLYQPMSV